MQGSSKFCRALEIRDINQGIGDQNVATLSIQALRIYLKELSQASNVRQFLPPTGHWWSLVNTAGCISSWYQFSPSSRTPLFQPFRDLINRDRPARSISFVVTSPWPVTFVCSFLTAVYRLLNCSLSNYLGPLNVLLHAPLIKLCTGVPRIAAADELKNHSNVSWCRF